MTFNPTLKRALAGALLIMAGSLPAIAKQTVSDQEPLTTRTATPNAVPITGAGTQPGKVFGQTYAPPGQVGPQQAQIVYYRDSSAGAGRSAAAEVYVDGELQTALLPNGYSVFCVNPGEHTLGAYIHDAPLYKGKTTGGSRTELKGGMTYFVKVGPAGSNGTPVVVQRKEAESQLQGMRVQRHVLSRASAVQACDYPSVSTLQPAAAAPSDIHTTE